MAIHNNSDFAQTFVLRGKLNRTVELPNTAEIEIVLAHTASNFRLTCNTRNEMVALEDPLEGKFTLNIPAATTARMPTGQYNVVAHRVDNQRTRLFGGIVNVESEF